MSVTDLLGPYDFSVAEYTTDPGPVRSWDTFHVEPLGLLVVCEYCRRAHQGLLGDGRCSGCGAPLSWRGAARDRYDRISAETGR